MLSRVVPAFRLQVAPKDTVCDVTATIFGGDASKYYCVKETRTCVSDKYIYMDDYDLVSLLVFTGAVCADIIGLVSLCVAAMHCGMN